MNVIIVHGAFGYPDENWFGWMKDELNKAGITCFVPALPTPEGQTLENWMDKFGCEANSYINYNSILIGHSLGAVFILRWLEHHHVRVNSVILVGVFIQPVGIQQFDLINQSFIGHGFNWDVIKSTNNQFTCVYGTNDPYVSDAQFVWIARQLSAKKMIISNGAHLNAQAGFIEFPHLLKYVIFSSSKQSITLDSP